MVGQENFTLNKCSFIYRESIILKVLCSSSLEHLLFPLLLPCVFLLCFQILSLFFYVFSLVLCYPAHDRLPFASELVTIFSSKFDVSLLLLTESLLYMLLLLVTGHARNCQCFPYLNLCCSSFHCWCSLFLFLQFSVTISCWKICYPQ